MNELTEEINKFGGWENSYQYLLTTYGETKQQKEYFIKKTHTSEIQSFRGKQNTREQQRIKGKKGAIKSTQVRFEGSNEQTKPWKVLGKSRSWYYKQKRLGKIT